MSKPTKTHRAAGSTDTRKSHRTYTHAVVADVFFGDRYVEQNGVAKVCVWSMSEANAVKAARHYETRPKFYSNVRVVPVTRDE